MSVNVVWEEMGRDMVEFMWQYLYCHGINAGTMMPSLKGNMAQSSGIEEREIYMKYLLVLVDILSRYVWLQPAVSCSEVASRTVLKCCGLFGMPKQIMRSGASHYHNKVCRRQLVADTRLGSTNKLNVGEDRLGCSQRKTPPCA